MDTSEIQIGPMTSTTAEHRPSDVPPASFSTSNNFSEYVAPERSECVSSDQGPDDGEIMLLGVAVARSKANRQVKLAKKLEKRAKRANFKDPPYNSILWCCCPVQMLCLPVVFFGLCFGCAWGEDDLGVLIPCETIWLKDEIGFYEGTNSPCERCCVCCCINPLIKCNTACGMHRDV